LFPTLDIINKNTETNRNACEVERNHSTAITQDLANILWMDFTDPKKYSDDMVSLELKGLVPKILGLENNKSYAFFVEGH